MKKMYLIFALLCTISSQAREIFLSPNDWSSDGAALFVHSWGSGSDIAGKMTKVDDNVYAFEIGNNTNCLFVRQDPRLGNNIDWHNRWNKTGDLAIPADKNCYTITSWGGDGSWGVVKIGDIDFKVDGIYYNILENKTNEVEVTEGTYEYTGIVTIPATVTYNGTTYSVTSIGDEAFYNCTGLTSITIPNSVTSIGNYAFQWCHKLTSITIPNSVTSIGNYAFDDCYRLTSITIPNSVTTIGDYAFNSCWGLTSITITDGVTSIGEGAFFGCSGLTNITIPHSVKSLGLGRTFQKCISLKSIQWNAIKCTITETDNGGYYPPFDALTNVEKFIFDDSVTTITAYLCCGLSGLTNITIPNSVTSIGDGAFIGCSSLTNITIPNSVTWIGDYAFYDCSGLTSVTIPNSVTSIGNLTFYNCSSLTSFTIPKGVTWIGKKAFAGCTRLYDIYSYASYPPFVVEESAFTNYNATLYIPCDSEREYTLDPVWGKFQNIECFNLPSDVENVDSQSTQLNNSQKIIRDGQLFLLRDGKIYNVMGVEIQ